MSAIGDAYMEVIHTAAVLANPQFYSSEEVESCRETHKAYVEMEEAAKGERDESHI